MKCFLVSIEAFFKPIATAMTSRRHLEVFNQIKPKLDLGISIASFYISSQRFRDHLLIRAPCISAILALIFGTLHIANTFDGYLTMNIAMSCICWVGSLQVCLKTFSMRYYRENLLKLLDKVESLHNDYENNMLSKIGERNLIKFSNIWITFFKYEFFF